MDEFKIGDAVVDKTLSTLKGKVTGFIPANPEKDEHEIVVVKIWIPENEPGFWITGVYEEMWFAPVEIEKIGEHNDTT